MPKLLISLPTGEISKELTGEIITIGRAPDNKVQINHHSVSSHHARLSLANGNYRIKDLQSTNRTCVNGMPVNEAELTASCILRIGSVECVYKAEKADTGGGDSQLQFQVSELQRQVESLMKARDLIHQQNRMLTKERDEARQEAEIRQEMLNDAKKVNGQLSSGNPDKEQLQDISTKHSEAKKQVELMSREREALLISNQELKTQVSMLTAKTSELQQKVTQLTIQQNVAASVQQHATAAKQQHVPAAVQEQAAARVRNEMDESVEEEYEEQEMAAAAPQKTAAAGGAAGKILSAPSLIGSWLNRGKRKADEPAETNKITSLPPPQIEAKAAVPAQANESAVAAPVPAAAPGNSPALRLVTSPQKPDTQRLDASSPAVKIGRASANVAPQHPEVRPVWDLLNQMRRSLHYFLRHQDELKVLQEMTDGAHQLTELTQAELLRPIHELAAAMESLIADLHASPTHINPSTLRTVGQCIDFIATLIHESNLSQIRDVTSARIFAVDDDEGVLEIIKATMEMVHVNIDTASQSSLGLSMLSEQNYDMILLDVGLPEMNGMDICSRVRAMPHHQKTPIVFLTGEATVQNRVQSTLNGGNDMIGKPFSVLELAVKVIVWIFKGQLAMV